MTQKDLAEQLHVSDRTVSKWERGAGVPDASLMIALSDILGITVNELLSGDKNIDRNYTLTAQGQAELEEFLCHYREMTRAVDRLIQETGGRTHEE